MVATPIGNLRDITIRALDVLKSVDVVAAEDTRQTHKLLSHHGIAARMLAVHEHNERSAAEQIVSLLAGGKSVALVTDAGTPGLSDPGSCAVAKVREHGLKVVPLPGPSALTAAISVAALSGSRFRFAGFLPARPAERRAALADLAATADPIVFYEAPHRIAQTLRDMARFLGGERRIVIARELTKVFEEIHECALDAAAAWLELKPGRSRGEFVLVVGPAPAPRTVEPPAQENVLRVLLAHLPLKQAVALAAEITGARRKALYQRALASRQPDDAVDALPGRRRRRSTS